MAESGESQPITELNPVQKQTQLRTIYSALPETDSIAERKGPGHFTFNIPRTGITPEEQSTRFPEDVKNFMKNSLENKELRRIKFEELNKLLYDAKIPQLLKDRIKRSFEGGFTFGITREAEEKDPASIFRIIGATPNSDMQEGIFSMDNSIRLGVTQQYSDKLKGVIDTYKDYIKKSEAAGRQDRVQYFNDNIQRIQSDIDTLSTQSKELFGSEPTI